MSQETTTEPALSPAQWDDRRFDEIRQDQVRDEKYLVIEDSGGDGMASISGAAQLRATIALANDLLDDDDPAKISWAMVDALRQAADRLVDDARDAYQRSAEDTYRLARLLAAYLPPR
jgi:hypothetical protein